VQFRDRALLRLLGDDPQADVLAAAVGTRVLAAAFDPRNAELGDATGVELRRLALAPGASAVAEVHGAADAMGASMRWDVSGSIVRHDSIPAADALVEVIVTAETRTVATEVTGVRIASLADVGDLEAVDARIVAADGALPADAAALDSRRLDEMTAMLVERSEVPAELDVPTLLDRWGVQSASELAARLQPPHHASLVGLDLVIDASLPARVANHPATLAVLLREDPVADLLAVMTDVQRARTALAGSVTQPRPPAGAELRTALPVLVVCAEASFDDDDLPLPAGPLPADPAAARRARVSALGQRLAPHGVALAPLSLT
jgi:hypothetical protein